MQTKVAIVGSSGYIGSRLVSYLLDRGNEVIRIDQSSAPDSIHLDLSDADNFNYDQLDGIGYLILTAAISSPDVCKDNYEFAYAINVTGTEKFVMNALEKGCKVIFFSSDAVYGENINAVFDENSPTNANTPYGLMKKHIEDRFRGFENFKALRLSYVVSKDDKFTKYLHNCMINDTMAEIFHPLYRNCIMLNELMETIGWLMTNWDLMRSSVLNLCGRELISRVRLADEFNRVNEMKLKYTIVHPKEEFFESRPKVTEMKSLYLKNIIQQVDESISVRLQNQNSI